MKRMLHFLFPLALASATTFAIAEPADSLTGKIWSVEKHDFVSFPDMLRTLHSKRYILIGERHGREAHQGREAFVLGALAEARRYPALMLEMLDRDQEAVVETYRKTAPEYAMGLGGELNWASTNWPSWTYYSAVFDAAFVAKLEIVGADLSEAEQASVSPFEMKADAALAKSFEYYKGQMLKAHCDLISDERATNLAFLQMARDERMSKVVLDRADRWHGALLIAGASHIRRSTGIPIRLPPDQTAIVLLLESAGSTAEFLALPRQIIGADPGEFDFIWFTSATGETSICDHIEKAR